MNVKEGQSQSHLHDNNMNWLHKALSRPHPGRFGSQCFNFLLLFFFFVSSQAGAITHWMFQRRVASSCGIPYAMWQSMHIMSKRQASRMLPPLVPLTSHVSMTIAMSGAVLAMPELGLVNGAADMIELLGGACNLFANESLLKPDFIHNHHACRVVFFTTASHSCMY
jgi:hypothetical protein